MRRLWSFLVRDFHTEISYRLSFVMNLGGILLSALTFFFISELMGDIASPYLSTYDVDYFSFVIIGIAFSGYFGVGLNSFARSLRLAQTTGTLEAMVMTPAPLSVVVIGSSLWSYVLTTFRVIIYLLLGTLLFTLQLQGANIPATLITLFLSIVAFASIGILAAGIIIVIKRGETLTTFFGAFANLIGGIYYPVEIMPEWLQFLSRLVPVTYAVRAMRLTLLAGASLSEIVSDLLALILFILVLLPLSLVVFHQAIKRARLDGSLAHY